MGSKQEMKPNALCMPLPLQGHINPMLKLAKILHSKGFVITFVNTEFNHQRFLRSSGSDTLKGFPSFHFETIPDGLQLPENINANQDLISLLKSIRETGLGSLKTLLDKVNASDSPVTCLVIDFVMGFTLPIAEELGIRGILFYTSGSSSLICGDQYPNLVQKFLMPLKDSSNLLSGYLDTVIDVIPTMGGICLKDLLPVAGNMSPDDEFLVKLVYKELERAKNVAGVIVNTFLELEFDILGYLSSIFPICYGIGPLNLLENKLGDRTLTSIQSSLWKEEPECLKWLDSKEPLSVIYVNFGSITLMTPQQLVEFGWGLAKSKCSFLWIIRPDLIIGDSVVLPPEFLAETCNRGFLGSWCPQEEVLSHQSIGGFLTHGGWNSITESISNGVPMICWPWFADQGPNCWCICKKWGVAMKIKNDVKSDEVAKLVIELMNGEKGIKMRKNAMDLKYKAEKACTSPFGSSVVNLEKVIHFLQTSLK